MVALSRDLGNLTRQSETAALDAGKRSTLRDAGVTELNSISLRMFRAIPAWSSGLRRVSRRPRVDKPHATATLIFHADQDNDLIRRR